MIVRIDDIWKIVNCLTNSDGIVDAFDCLMTACCASDGTLWRAGNPLVPIKTYSDVPDEKIARKVIAEGTPYSDSETVCVPLRKSGKIYGCMQLKSAKDQSFIFDAAGLFEKKLDELPEETEVISQKKRIISVIDVCKSYSTAGQKTEVLRHIDLDIFENELLVVLGASGTGKTTMLNLLGGLDTADSGSIVVGSTDIAKMSERQLCEYRRNQVGFVFQFYSLMPSLTVEENLRYAAELVKQPMSTKAALEKVGMWDFRNYYPSQLSSGQQQRVAIARALAKRPSIILADEPTGALDLSNSKDALIALEEITSSQQGAIVLITHNPEICRIADRIVNMTQGRIESIEINYHKQSASGLRW